MRDIQQNKNVQFLFLYYVKIEPEIFIQYESIKAIKCTPPT
jgi:hypothetical protein